jgi:hypothetical protein
MDVFRCDGKCLCILEGLYPPALTALPVRFYYRADVCTGEDDDKQEVFQGQVTNMDTSARSKVDLVSTVRYSSLMRYTAYTHLDACDYLSSVTVRSSIYPIGS